MAYGRGLSDKTTQLSFQGATEESTITISTINCQISMHYKSGRLPIPSPTEWLGLVPAPYRARQAEPSLVRNLRQHDQKLFRRPLSACRVEVAAIVCVRGHQEWIFPAVLFE